MHMFESVINLNYYTSKYKIAKHLIENANLYIACCIATGFKLNCI